MAYQHLFDLTWDGEEGKQINLLFGHATVKIFGRNLQELAQQLAGEKVRFIQEDDPARWDKPTGAEPCIDRIEYTLTRGEPMNGEGKEDEKGT